MRTYQVALIIDDVRIVEWDHAILALRRACTGTPVDLRPKKMKENMDSGQYAELKI